MGQAERRPNTATPGAGSRWVIASLDPTYKNAHRELVREADKAWHEANALIQATGYHRRDGELAALRTTLDALAA